MKYSAIYLPTANRDIVRIDEALTDYQNKAMRLFQEIERKVLNLEDNPYMYPVYPLRSKYRYIVLDDHLLFYIVDDGERKVKVFRVLYSKMDILSQLDE